MRLFRAHDGATIRRIQDTLDCCGYNSVRDRAFPFTTTAPSTCAETYGRAVACVKPWRGAMQVNSGLEFGIVMAVGLMQVCYIPHHSSHSCFICVTDLVNRIDHRTAGYARGYQLVDCVANSSVGSRYGTA